MPKKDFRLKNNHVARDCEGRAQSLLNNVTLEISMRAARKVRYYMRAYMSDYGVPQLLIEKFVKIHKCHQNILDQDLAFLDKMLAVIDEHANIVKEAHASLAAEEKELPKQKEAGRAKRG